MVIDKIVDINASIDAWFRNSNLPKFIKVMIAKNRRRKLSKLIEKYSDMQYDVDDIFEFLCYTFRFNPPNGEFMYVTKIRESVNEEVLFGNTNINKITYTYFGNMRYGETNDETLYDFDIVVSNNNRFELGIKVVTPNGVKKIATGGKELLKGNSKREIVNDLVEALNSLMGEMVISMLGDVLKRSERIYELW